MEIITNFAEALQANPALLVAISLWEALFTLLALWFAARNDHKGWFVICGFNTTIWISRNILSCDENKLF